jgi:hypothetical protein
MTEWKNTFRVGVYTCEMVYRPGREMKVEWRPDMPKARSFSAQMMDEYRNCDRRERHGRRSMSATVVQAKDGKWAVVRPGEPISETGRYETNADAWRAADGPDPSRGELVAEWVFEQSLGEMFR